MPNETLNKIVVMLFVLLVIIALYPAFRKVFKEVKRMYQEDRGIKIR